MKNIKESEALAKMTRVIFPDHFIFSSYCISLMGCLGNHVTENNRVRVIVSGLRCHDYDRVSCKVTLWQPVFVSEGQLE